MSGAVRRAFRWLPRPDRANTGMWAIAGGHATTHTYTAAFGLLLPFIAKDLGLTFSQIGVLIAVRQTMSMVINLPAGMIVDTVGRRRLLMAIALTWAAVPYLIISRTSSYGVLVVCMTLVGIGNFLWHPAAITSISELYPGRRGYGLALHELGSNLGDTLTPLAAGFLLAYLTWRQILTVNVVLGVVIAAVLARMLSRVRQQPPDITSRPPSVRNYTEGILALARNSNLLVLALVSGIRSMTQTGLSTFLPLYLVYEPRDAHRPRSPPAWPHSGLNRTTASSSRIAVAIEATDNWANGGLRAGEPSRLVLRGLGRSAYLNAQ